MFNLSSYTVLGQYCGIIADQLSEVWELARVVHDVMNPDNASDAQLSNLARLTGTDRRGSTKSVANVSLTIDVGTYPAGTLIANVSSNPDSRFVNRDDLTIAVAGVNSGIIFEAETAGNRSSTLRHPYRYFRTCHRLDGDNESYRCH